MTYEQAVEYIEALTNYERTSQWRYPEAVKLDRMKRLAKAFGNPQNAYESVIIAGSKGKGSTAAFLSSILRMENYRVGLFTSPHLLDIRERIQVNGLLVSQPRFTELVERLRRALDDPSWRKDPPTYFEALTVIAFTHFKEMKVQIAVLEVGLGGLYDSTNIAPARAVGITSISLEHTDKLGKTVSKIAVQKCGAIKGREIVVSASQTKEVEAVIAKAGEQKDAQVWRVGKEIRVIERGASEESQRFDLRAPFADYYDLQISLLGAHQMENAGIAVGLAKALEEKARLKVSEVAVRRGLVDAHWPGRLEKMAGRPLMILDGAHNVESLISALSALRRHFHFDKLFVVFGVSSDKDVEGMLKELAPQVSRLVVTKSQNPRAMETARIVEIAKNLGVDVRAEDAPLQALECARAEASENDLVLVTGSLFLLAEIKHAQSV